MCRWTGCLFRASSFGTGCLFELSELGQGAFFELPTLGTRLACILLISHAIISRIPAFFSNLRAESHKIAQTNIKEL